MTQWLEVSLGVNFINILQEAFTRTDPESKKKTDNLTVFFALSGSALVKAACKWLVKLTPGLNFINILCTAFTLVDPKSIKKTVKLTVAFGTFGTYERKSCT